MLKASSHLSIISWSGVWQCWAHGWWILWWKRYYIWMFVSPSSPSQLSQISFKSTPPPPNSAISALQTPRATVGGKRPRDFSQSQPQLSPRPAVGGKKPRSMFYHSCQKCEEYKEIIATQDQDNLLKVISLTFNMISTHKLNHNIENAEHFLVCLYFGFSLDWLIVGEKMGTSCS